MQEEKGIKVICAGLDKSSINKKYLEAQEAFGVNVVNPVSVFDNPPMIINNYRQEELTFPVDKWGKPLVNKSKFHK